MLLFMQKKFSMLVMFLLPILIVLFIGFAFSNVNPASVNIGVFSPQDSTEVESFLTGLNNSRFYTQEMETEELCKQKVKLGEKHICMVIDDLKVEDQQKTIEFYVDYTRVNLVHNIINSMDEAVDERSQKITRSITEDIVSNVDTTAGTLAQVKERLTSVKNNVEGAIEKIDPLQTQLVDLRSNLSSHNIETQELSEQIIDLKARLDDTAYEFNESINDVEDKFDELESYTNSSSQNLLDELIDLNMDFRNISDQLNGSNQSLTETVSTYNEQLKNQTQNQNERVQSARKTLREMSQNIQGIKTTLTTEKENIQKAIDKIDESITTLAETNGDSNLISNPLKTTITSITSEKTHFNIIFAGLVVVVLMLTSLLLSSSLVLNEKFSRAYFRNMISPTNTLVFNFAIYFTTLLVLFVQLALFFGISALVFQTTFVGASFLKVFAVLFLGTSFFILTGMTIAYLFNSEAAINLAVTFITAILLFFSDLILPIENMAPVFQRAALISPFMLIKELLQTVMFFDVSTLSVSSEIFQLFLYVLEIGIILTIILIIHRVKIWFFFHGNAGTRKANPAKAKKKQKGYKNPYA